VGVSNLHSDLYLFLVTLMSFFLDGKNLGILLSDSFVMTTGEHLAGREPDIAFVSP
jgi:hypothetical protein